MKNKCLTCIVFLILTGCRDNIDVIGCWHRNVIDSELGVEGKETLFLNQDSTFRISNVMNFQYVDSIFECAFKFNTTVGGDWTTSGNGLKLYFDVNTYSFDTIPNHYYIKSLREDFPDSLLFELKHNLIYEIAEYYRTVYECKESKGLSFTNVSIEKDILEMDQDAVSLVWSR